MTTVRLALITTAAMIAFAGNSLLCRLALTSSQIDPESFTSIRLISGAVTLIGLVWLKHRSPAVGGNWLSAVALFAYAAGFSFAYVSMPAGTGALLLFGAVQATMIGYGLLTGERLNSRQMIGIALAIAGLIGLLLPGVEAPPLAGSLFMLGAGVAWGIYSLRGHRVEDSTKETSGNFLRSVPLAVVVSVVMFTHHRLDYRGVVYAVASGALASGIGYALWYTVLPFLRAMTAATVQLSVPAIAALGGVIFLGESITLKLGVASGAIIGGIAVFILSKGDQC